MIAVEDCYDLDPEGSGVIEVGRHHSHDTGLLWQAEYRAQRENGAAARERRQRLRHDRDALVHWQQRGNVGLRDDQHGEAGVRISGALQCDWGDRSARRLLS